MLTLLILNTIAIHPITYTNITYVIRFYKTDPNCTPGKIKLTPPVDSYTIVITVWTLGTTQSTRG